MKVNLHLLKREIDYKLMNILSMLCEEPLMHKNYQTGSKK